MSYTARCCCGACALELEGEPTMNGLCHCANCKKRTGSAFGWSVYFADVQIAGRSGDLVMYQPRSATPQTRWFCARCGTTLYWKSDFMPTHTGVAGGCLADQDIPPPTFQASIGGRCLWVGLPDSWPTAP